MANTFISTNGKKILAYRGYTKNADLSSTQYLPPTKFKVGVDSGSYVISSSDLTYAIPIADGTPLDPGDNNMTGSSGGDNSTDNTTRYKEGAGLSDATSQNLIKNNTNAVAIWTETLTTFAIGSKYTGLWIYIKDATTLAKLVSSGTALEIKLGSDASNYYSKTWTTSNLSVGWNWLPMGALNTNTETGTVTGDIDTFIIEITTNNATDTFIAGDVLYDLLRQWEDSDLIKSYVTGYPSISLTTLETEIQCFLNSIEANGFLVDSMALFNEDTTPLMQSVMSITEESKSSTDEFTFIAKDEVK